MPPTAIELPSKVTGAAVRRRLRASFANPVRQRRRPLDRIMRQTRRSSVGVALRYIRLGQIGLWHDNPSAALGL